mmetsp:Transcript_15146/g.13291  ORF Transcript_15146/g.13291 Transcript_15146/m.13291 type:complete len:108 (+) Transcript_15146:35-358(+)
MSLFTIILILAFVSMTYAACDVDVSGFDCNSKWTVADYIGVIVGYTITAIFLAYVIVRLFYEEKVRFGEYKDQLAEAENEAAHFNITFEDLVEQDKRKADEEADNQK